MHVVVGRQMDGADMTEGSTESANERQGHDPAGGCGWLMIAGIAIVVLLCVLAVAYLFLLRQ
jgi:hypothetical protein